MKKPIIETWQSDQNNIERHHFLGKSKATYIFGINPSLVGPKAYNKIYKICMEEVKKNQAIKDIKNKHFRKGYTH